ncbi:MAG: MBL fold metallo-hydrolase [Anaerolineae bacterium]
MDITWYGQSCFRITERGRISIITDPYSEEVGLPVPKLKGDVVTVSHNSPGHSFVEAVKGYTYVLNGPGEYEIGGVFVSGVAMHHTAHNGDVYPNVVYVIRYDALTVAHLGDLAHVPDQSTIEALGEVNVALVPVGGGNALKAAAAAEVIALIEPNYIVPMHFDLPNLHVALDPVERFLKEMGVSKVMEEDTLRLSAQALPEQPQVVVLRPQE